MTVLAGHKSLLPLSAPCLKCGVHSRQRRVPLSCSSLKHGGFRPNVSARFRKHQRARAQGQGTEIPRWLRESAQSDMAFFLACSEGRLKSESLATCNAHCHASACHAVTARCRASRDTSSTNVKHFALFAPSHASGRACYGALPMQTQQAKHSNVLRQHRQGSYSAGRRGLSQRADPTRNTR